MKKNIFLITIVLFLTGCILHKPVILTEADNNREIKAAMGDTFKIKLAANPTTGYTWAITENDQGVLKESAPESYKVDTKLIGSPGVSTFSFKIVGKGNTTLKLSYRRSWEHDVAPASIFTLQISAK